MFCRHNRLTANCPICTRELEAQLPKPPPRVRRAAPARRAAARPARTGGVVTRRVARAADDGYRNPLVPGLRAGSDAERLAAAITAAAVRLEPPGPYPELAAEPDLEEATWLGFLLALAGPERSGDERASRGRTTELPAALRAAPPRWADGVAPDLPPERARTAAAYRAWV